MNVIINGETREFPDIDQFTITELIARLDLGPQPVLVELNGEAIFEKEFDDKIVVDQGEVEIVRMVAGG